MASDSGSGEGGMSATATASATAAAASTSLPPLPPLLSRVFAKLEPSTLAEDVNAAKTANFFVNRRGQRMHFKHFLPGPSDPPLRHIVVYLHGLDAHISRPAFEVYGEVLIKAGIGLFALDQVGHGYSEGDRSYIRYYSYLLDDATQLLRTILVDDPALSRLTEKVRFQIIGQSMGGTVTAALGILINGCKHVGYFNDESQISFLHSLKSRYAGSILLCPALSLSLPPFLILLTMQYCVVPLFPATEIPTFLSDVKPKEFAWKDRKYIEYIRSDGFPNNPKGISWSGAIRFATAQSILDLIAVVRDIISTGSNHFPFVVMHDPDDQVCSYNGSKFLIECSQSSSHQHDLVDMPDGFHDLWTNKIDFICEYIIKNC